MVFFFSSVSVVLLLLVPLGARRLEQITSQFSSVGSLGLDLVVVVLLLL